MVFRVENQHCAAWGVAVADLHRTDPPVYVQDRDGGSWKPFLDGHLRAVGQAPQKVMSR